MPQSQSLKNILPALLLAQSAMTGASKDSTNPHFKSSYSDLASVMDACKSHLNDNGILITQTTKTLQIPLADGKVDLIEMLKTTLYHAPSSEYISSECRIICVDKTNPQKHGSAMTYAKRYNLQALVVLPSIDDDGQLNAGSTTKPTPKASTKPIKPTPKKPSASKKLAPKFP